MGGVADVAAVADQLEPANDLAHGEEANALGGNDAASRQLGRAERACALQDGGRRLDKLERAGVLDLLPGVLEVGLEDLDGAEGLDW